MLSDEVYFAAKTFNMVVFVEGHDSDAVCRALINTKRVLQLLSESYIYRFIEEEAYPCWQDWHPAGSTSGSLHPEPH